MGVFHIFKIVLMIPNCARHLICIFVVSGPWYDLISSLKNSFEFETEF